MNREARELIRIAKGLVSAVKSNQYGWTMGWQYSDNDGGLYGESDGDWDSFDSFEEMLNDRSSWSEIKHYSKYWNNVGRGAYETEFEQDDAEMKQHMLQFYSPGKKDLTNVEEKMVEQAMKKNGMRIG